MAQNETQPLRFLSAHQLATPLDLRFHASTCKRNHSTGDLSDQGYGWPQMDAHPSSFDHARHPSVCLVLLSHWKHILQILVTVLCVITLAVVLTGETACSVRDRLTSSGAWTMASQQQHLLMDVSQGNVTAASLAMDVSAIAEAGKIQLPPDFDWQAYLWWNADVQAAGHTTREQAEAHYTTNGHAENRLHKRARITLRYTACGGLFNQHYCHLSAITLAVVSGVAEVIWPPMQERASFAKRYSTDAGQNVQTWQYVDAETLWDLPNISKNLKDKFDLVVTKHPPNCPMPDFNHPTTAYQLCPLESKYDLRVKFSQDMYIKHIEPDALRVKLFQTIQDGYLQGGAGKHPDNILVEFPCTLFMMEFRKTPMVEDIAQSFAWAPSMQALANKVIAGIKKGTNGKQYNGIHLRMEKDAADWAVNTGGMEHYWQVYKDVMVKAKFNIDPKALYVASGLLKSAQGPEPDLESKIEMERLSKEIINLGYATSIVFKEMYLTEQDLKPVLNEQSALIDFLVLRESGSVVGVGMSTFSFYLQEDRLMKGRDPSDMAMLMMPSIGTDELFFSAAVAAIKTRAKLVAEGRLHEVCQRATLEPCFSRR